MSGESRTISYQTPAPRSRRVHPIVWWFIADGILFFATFMTAAMVYHENPPGYSVPRRVDALLTVMLLASVILLVSLLVWGVRLMVRGRGRVG
jgi:heme/copper-type cytochrome/quinol oxidase subunit 3